MFRLILVLILIQINSAFSQEKYSEFPQVKCRNQIKAYYGITYFYGSGSFKSYGVELLRESKLKIKNKFNFLYGISYFYRPLVEDRSNPFNRIDVAGARGSLNFNHHYIEFPLILSTFSKKKNFYFGIAPALLIYGTFDIGRPDYFVQYSFGKINYSKKNVYLDSYRYFFNPINIKAIIGYGYPISKNAKVGMDLNMYAMPIGKNYECGPTFINCEKRRAFLMASSLYFSVLF